MHRIAVVSFGFPPKWAGPVERFLRYANGFRERGFELFFVTRNNTTNEIEKEQHRNCDVFKIPSRDWKYGQESFVSKASKWLAIQEESEKPTLVIYLSYSMNCLFCLNRLKKKGIPCIAISTMFQPAPKGIRGWTQKQLIRMQYAGFDRIVTSSQTLMQNIVDFGVNQEKLCVIPNGVDQTRFCPVSPSERVKLRSQLSLPSEAEPVALFVGLRNPRKGVLPLIEAWKIYKNNGGAGTLVLVGADADRSDPQYSDFLVKWDREIKQAKEYSIDVRASSANIERYFQAADLFVFLSNLEGLPNVLPESMACGVPVMMNKYQGFSPEIGRENVEFFPTNRDPKKIADDINFVIQAPDLRNRFRDSALQHINAVHSFEKTQNSYSDLFEELIGRAEQYL